MVRSCLFNNKNIFISVSIQFDLPFYSVALPYLWFHYCHVSGCHGNKNHGSNKQLVAIATITLSPGTEREGKCSIRTYLLTITCTMSWRKYTRSADTSWKYNPTIHSSRLFIQSYRCIYTQHWQKSLLMGTEQNVLNYNVCQQNDKIYLSLHQWWYFSIWIIF